MYRTTSTKSVYSVYLSLLAAMLLPIGNTALGSLTALQHLIANPSDGGAGPGIWLSSSGTSNAGSDRPGPPPDGLATYTLTDPRSDFFGNEGMAFALRTHDAEGNPTTSGAGIAGSTATPYLQGNTASVVLTFKTPATFSTVSLLERGPDSAANSFELVLLNTGVLRLSYRNTTSSDRSNLQTLAPNTWYFVAITWDLSNPSQNLQWFVGQMGSATLNRGLLTATVVGDSTSAIRVAGRANSLFFYGSYQNIALYDRTLTPAAIEDQFASITADLKRISDSIANPADNGSGPAIWLATSGLVNSGSAATSLVTFTLDKPGDDYFGNPSLAYSIRDSATTGAGISGSGSTGFATGASGSVTLFFKTPPVLANASLFSRGQFSSPPNFEIFLFVDADTPMLRLTLDEQEAYDIATVSPDTWYFLNITWDTGLAVNPVSWYHGRMQDAPAGLSSGNITTNNIGNPGQSIFIGGRPATANSNFSGFFQNIAIYDRALSPDAVTAQYAAIYAPASSEASISLQRSNGMLEIDFTGILQESTDLDDWQDSNPQPASPVQLPLLPGDKRFFRSKAAD